MLVNNLPKATVFTLGDNVYSNGTATEFTNYYNPTWGAFKSRTRPAPGNHDYNTSGATGYYGTSVRRPARRVAATTPTTSATGTSCR